jgi:hypothetical protein
MTSEYAATIVRLPETYPLDNCDNVVGASFYGLQAIVSKDSEPGTLGVLFVTESQLSEEYLRENNLYREPALNKDPSQKGYFDNNRRVRAQKFRGHRSDAFWMPIDSLNYIPAKVKDPSNPLDLHEGFRFEELDGHVICKKYIPKGAKGMKQQQTPKVTRVSEKLFPQHMDTSNFFRNLDKVPEDAYLVVTQKLHGTSVRIGRVPVQRKLSFLERLAKKFKISVQETEYALVAGSRRVIKSVGDEIKATPSFYKEDIYSQMALRFGDRVPEGFIVYGEIIGWTPDGAEIQKGYTYQIPKGLMELYVYRVTTINPQGVQVDLSWQAVKDFCAEMNLNHVPEIDRGDRILNWEMWGKDILEENIQNYLDVRLAERFGSLAEDYVLPLEPGNPCDEGVCVRVEGLRPQIYKAKSPMFLQHETKLLDQEVIDMETVG